MRKIRLDCTNVLIDCRCTHCCDIYARYELLVLLTYERHRRDRTVALLASRGVLSVSATHERRPLSADLVVQYLLLRAQNQTSTGGTDLIRKTSQDYVSITTIWTARSPSSLSSYQRGVAGMTVHGIPANKRLSFCQNDHVPESLQHRLLLGLPELLDRHNNSNVGSAKCRLGSLGYTYVVNV